ncbi:hypothetical protein PIIN_09260 [Serendipita indica DSM 11827]|uniref:Dynamin N-terminal domain-containing protein n=1 Tax=Serendipita indica (strain DSM 11827) TaxID=1109443 RepID=G4TVD3_SERID|nr:hypothetical protein PIIN_09260 [Serendipita indica DSM 11827]
MDDVSTALVDVVSPEPLPNAEEIMRQLSARLRTARRAFGSACKHLDQLQHPPPIPRAYNRKHGTNNLLTSGFWDSPFAVDSGANLYNPVDGVAKVYKESMVQLGHDWAEEFLNQLDVQQIQDAAVVNATAALFRQLWNRTSDALWACDLHWPTQGAPAASLYAKLVDQLDQNLRDSLLRQETEIHSAVFVGLHGSGKSSLINAIIGCDVLPTGVGVTTLMPCRIVHDRATPNPELHLDAPPFNQIIHEIREHLVKSPGDMEEFNIKASTLEEVPSVTTGIQNINKTLARAHDLIRISVELGIGYQGTTMKDWATIKLRFPNFPDEPLPGNYEIIDIPDYWTVFARETIRQASIVVAVVSAISYLGGAWKTLPGVIAGGTNLRATIVIVTMMDMLKTLTLTWESQPRDLRRAFWPASINSAAPSGIYLECSVRDGLVLNEFSAHASPPSPRRSPKSEFQELSKGKFGAAFGLLYPADTDHWHKTYADDGWSGALRKASAASIASNLDATIQTVIRVLKGTSSAFNPFEEIKGLSLQLRKIFALVEKRLATLRLLANVGDDLRLRHDEFQRKGEQFLFKWKEQQESPESVYDVLAKQSTRLVRDVSASYLHPTTDVVSTTLNIRLRTEDILEFETVADIDQFIESAQGMLSQQLFDLQTRLKALQEDEENSDLLDLLVEDLKRRFSEGDAFEKPLPPVVDFQLYTKAIEVNRDRASEYKQTQQMVWQRLSRKAKPPVDLASASRLLRALVAVIAIVPFTIKFPFIKETTTRYLLDLAGLRDALQIEFVRPWSDQFQWRWNKH